MSTEPALITPDMTSSVTLERVPVPSVITRAAPRLLAVLLSALLLLVLAPGAATAAPAEAAQLCTASDPRLKQVSGLVATPNGYAAINDGGDELVVYLLGRDCAVTRILTSPPDPFDPEDLSRTSDGMLWVADIGDNEKKRTSVVVWQVNPATGASVRHRLTYPDGAHDAEAMVMPANKTPIIVTKEPSGTSKVYVAKGPLEGDGTVIPMRSAGKITITSSGTEGGPASTGPAAQLLVTGGALSPDGTKVALRTYTDAYEWDVPNGDVLSAFSSGQPRRIPLPGEPQGESISYASDGTGFVTLSEGVGQPLQQWGTTAGAKKPSGSGKGGGSILPDLNLANLMGGIYVIGFVGLALLIAGIVGIKRFRRQQAARAAADDFADEPDDYDEDDDYLPEYDDRHAATDSSLSYPPPPAAPEDSAKRGTTYGSPAPAAAPPRGSGTVYGGTPRVDAPRGTVYGGGTTSDPDVRDDPPRRSGTVYGGGPS